MNINKHHYNTALLSLCIGRKLELCKTELEELYTAATVHDMGKFKIPHSILYKKGKLTNEEFTTIKRHSMIGYDMAKEKGYNTKICNAVLAHHERYDGLGYPNGLKGNQISLYARIIAIADSYDAMISSRIYREKSLTHEEALKEIIRNSGTQFDKDIVEIFIDIQTKLFS